MGDFLGSISVEAPSFICLSLVPSVHSEATVCLALGLHPGPPPSAASWALLRETTGKQGRRVQAGGWREGGGCWHCPGQVISERWHDVALWTRSEQRAEQVPRGGQ